MKSTHSIAGIALLGVCWLAPVTLDATSLVADAGRSSLQFSFIQAGARNSGVFREFSVQFEPPDEGSGGMLDVVIDTRSLDTQDGDRDTMLRSGYFFESDFYPHARFRSDDIASTGDGGYLATGQLTIRETTRDVTIPFTMEPATQESGPRIHGSLTIRRLDYDVGQGDWRSTTWIRNDVNISFDVRLTSKEQ